MYSYVAARHNEKTMQSSNPFLGEKSLHHFTAAGLSRSDGMTVKGALNKTIMLVLVVAVSAMFTWWMYVQRGPEAVYPFVIGGCIGGLILAIATFFKQEWAVFTAPIYAVVEGLAIGGISAMYEGKYSGIVLQAVLLTLMIVMSMLLVYRSGIIKLNDKLRFGIVAATGAIALLYIVNFGLHFAGIQIPLIHDSGPIGIGFSLFVIVLACFNLFMDFEFIDQGAAQQAPKHVEWFAAFGLLITIVWLYIEVLRLLSKLRR